MGEIIIVLFATFGASSVVSQYDGPRDIFLRLRDKYPNSALICTVCLSFWFGSLFYLLSLLGLASVLIPIAIVGIVVLLEKL